jgi:hypothetical protein
MKRAAQAFILHEEINHSISSDPYPDFKLFTFISVYVKISCRMLEELEEIFSAGEKKIRAKPNVPKILQQILKLFNTTMEEYDAIGDKFIPRIKELELLDKYCTKTEAECEELIMRDKDMYTSFKMRQKGDGVA